MIYLALGTNIEPRKTFLQHAKECLHAAGYEILSISPVYETPAMLPVDATNDWQKNYLNQVIAIDTTSSPNVLLEDIKKIEKDLGREQNLKWGPRTIDIDILLYHDKIISNDTLNIPHKELNSRNFFLRPLLDVASNIKDHKTLTSYSAIYKNLTHKLPKWMYILNLSEDSFSSSGEKRNYVTDVVHALEHGAHIIDVGAESTRPGATSLTAQEEQAILTQHLPTIIELAHKNDAKVSVDTYHSETMKWAIELGADIINDVGGLATADSKKVFRDSNVDWVIMHNLGLPANPKNILTKSRPAHLEILDWIKSLELSVEDKQRIYIDPGIGFGKDATQSRDLISHWKQIQDLGFKVLMGHSRKSFLTGITEHEYKDRDIETIGISLRLASEGVDVLRIHNIEDHRRAFMSYIA